MFNNKENERVELADGRVIWLSRSCAVSVTVVAIKDGIVHYLMVKRGEGNPDEQGRWVLPCGYLDWDETLVDGAIREVYEETGFHIRKYMDADTDDTILGSDFYSDQPWHVNSSIRNGKQNVTHYFGMVMEVTSLPELSSDNCELNEVADLKWVAIEDIGDYDIAFNHDTRIADYNIYVNNLLDIIYSNEM